MQLFTARVKFPAGKIFEGRYGERQNVVVEGNSGEATIWFNAGNEFYRGLRKGQTVRVFNKGTADKPQWRIVEPGRSTQMAAVSQPQPHRADGTAPRSRTHDSKDDFQELSHQVQLYEFAFSAVCQQFEKHGLPPGELTKIATTVYINFSKQQ